MNAPFWAVKTGKCGAFSGKWEIRNSTFSSLKMKWNFVFYMKEIACFPAMVSSLIPPFLCIIIKLEDLVTTGPSGALKSAPWPLPSFTTRPFLISFTKTLTLSVFMFVHLNMHAKGKGERIKFFSSSLTVKETDEGEEELRRECGGGGGGGGHLTPTGFMGQCVAV